MTPLSKPIVFVGSSGQAAKIAIAVAVQLETICEVRLWTEGDFRAANYTLTDLLKEAGECDFAVFVWAADDQTIIQEANGIGKVIPSTRDNVVLETGMFMGSLGYERVFRLHPDETKIKEPSDLAGANYVKYQSSSILDAQEATLEAVNKIGSSTFRVD